MQRHRRSDGASRVHSTRRRCEARRRASDLSTRPSRTFRRQRAADCRIARRARNHPSFSLRRDLHVGPVREARADHHGWGGKPRALRYRGTLEGRYCRGACSGSAPRASQLPYSGPAGTRQTTPCQRGIVQRHRTRARHVQDNGDPSDSRRLSAREGPSPPQAGRGLRLRRLRELAEGCGHLGAAPAP